MWRIPAGVDPPEADDPTVLVGGRPQVLPARVAECAVELRVGDVTDVGVELLAVG